MQTKRIVEMYRKRPVLVGTVSVIIVFFIALGIKSINSTSLPEQNLQAKPLVELASASSLSGGDSISLIGTVRAFTEAQITAERGGRVVSVNTKLGSKVSAGQTIATLENASERAAVLQAEGVYEAALAASAQSVVGVTEAENNLDNAKKSAINTAKSSYNTANGIVLNSIDQFYSSPNGSLPGLRIDGKGNTAQLNQERIAYQTLLPSWQTQVNALLVNSNLTSELEYSRANIARTINFVEIFLNVLSLQDSGGRYSDTELQNFTSTFTSLRASLLGAQSSIDGAITSLQAAEDTLSRAKISSTGGPSSAADAQLKQALGSLRAAQANYAKTILRTPISGTVNSLSVSAGDFIGAQTTVSVVANNAALEVVTFVGDLELAQLSVGDTVIVEDTYEGIVAQIAPAIDDQTRKTEVRIALESTDISNGDTVRITKSQSQEAATEVKMIWVPLTAVKFNESDGYMFGVEEGKLVKKDVTLGAIRGTYVEIQEGLNTTDEFVIDVRGLTEGDEVTVKI